jgi:hypothetical protein
VEIKDVVTDPKSDYLEELVSPIQRVTILRNYILESLLKSRGEDKGVGRGLGPPMNVNFLLDFFKFKTVSKINILFA